MGNISRRDLIGAATSAGGLVAAAATVGWPEHEDLVSSCRGINPVRMPSRGILADVHVARERLIEQLRHLCESFQR
jgi:hypothetical protein